MTQYRHETYGIVTVISAFSSHVNIQTSQGLKPAQWDELTPMDGGNPEAEVPAPLVPVTTVETVATVAVAAVETEPVETDKETKVPPTALEETKTSNSDLVNLNTSSVAVLDTKLPFIGRKRAKQIVTNRPATGYATWDDFRELNPTLLDDDNAWAKLQELVTV